MGTVKRHIKKHVHSNKVTYKKSLKTKGDRLGWVSLEDVEAVELRQVLTNGKVVRLNGAVRPMLVP
ncbi:hypothetical protein [Psychroserpens algicola]|uniref:hypothetical protein n=1 Tax=Psychroserpens algicola TaxID=1719034 RepID=UPI001952F3DD|nr:hypothetical protein [Psychroserpens algicola]